MTFFPSILGCVAFGWLAVFQALLAMGAPLGHMAWGGAERVLSRQKRRASTCVVPIALFGLLLIYQSATGQGILANWLVTPALWAFAGLFGLSFVGNAMTQSRIERLHGVPLTIVLCACCVASAL